MGSERRRSPALPMPPAPLVYVYQAQAGVSSRKVVHVGNLRAVRPLVALLVGSGPRPVDRPGLRGSCEGGGPGGREAGPVRGVSDEATIPSALELFHSQIQPKGSERGRNDRAKRSPPKVSNVVKRRGASEASGAEWGPGRSSA